MLTESQRSYLARAVRPMQVIVGALATGVTAFLAVVLVVANNGPPGEPFVTYVALAFAVVAFVGWLVVPNVVTSQARRAIAEGRMPWFAVRTAVPPNVGVVGQLAALFQTRLIIGSAILEGAAFLNLVAAMIEGHTLGLVVAVGLVLLLVSQFPTRERLEVWVSHELESIEQMRM